MKTRAYCRIRRFILSCLITTSSSLMMPAHAGPWDCGSDIVPVTEPKAEPSPPVPSHACALLESAAADRDHERVVEQNQRSDAPPSEENALASDRDAGCDIARSAPSTTSETVSPRPQMVGGWGTHDSMPPLARRRTSYSFASSLARITDGSASNLVHEPSVEKPVDLDRTMIEPEEYRKNRTSEEITENVASERAPSSNVTVRLRLEPCAAIEFNAAVERQLIDFECRTVTEQDFIRRQLQVLAQAEPVDTSGFAAPAEKIETLERPLKEMEAVAELADQVLSATGVRPDQFATSTPAGKIETLERPLEEMEAVAKLADQVLSATRVGSEQVATSTPAEKIKTLGQPLEVMKAVAELADQVLSAIGMGPDQIATSAPAELQTEADSADKIAAQVAADRPGRSVSQQQTGVEPSKSATERSQRIGSCVVITTLEEAYLPYDFAPEDLEVVTTLPNETAPFCLRDRVSTSRDGGEGDSVAKQAAEVAAPIKRHVPVQAKVAETPKAGRNAKVGGSSSDRAVDQLSEARFEATLAMCGSPYCLLDELVWRAEQTLCEGAPLRRALTPRAVGQQIAAIASRGNRAALVAVEAMGKAWPRQQRDTFSRAGGLSLARGGTNQNARSAAEPPHPASPVQKSPVKQSSKATKSLQPAPAADQRDTAAEEGVRRTAEWSEATATLQEWIATADSWSRQLWQVTRAPLGDQRLR